MMSTDTVMPVKSELGNKTNAEKKIIVKRNEQP